MIRSLDQLIGMEPPKEATAFISLLRIVQDQEKYLALVAKTISKAPGYEARKPLVEKLGKFSGQELVMLLYECGGGAGTRLHIVSKLTERLIKWGLISDIGVWETLPGVKYGWDTKTIWECDKLNILDNILLGETYFIQKYRRSVLALIISKGGDEHIGTGFLVSDRGDNRRSIIVTAKHNVDSANGAKFLRFEGVDETELKLVEKNWRLHPDEDIAFAPVEHSSMLLPLNLRGEPSVLSRVVTLGYPRIATSDRPYLLAHAGELNAIVSTYHKERRMIISNIVAPGNSGGPVLDEIGLCVGMVVNAFETKHEGGTSSASSAILSSAIFEFAGQYLTPN
jgi:hypothetical protein